MMPRTRINACKMITLFLTLTCLFITGLAWIPSSQARVRDGDDDCWQVVGRQAGLAAMSMMKHRLHRFSARDFIAITNAGYAEIGGASTMSALDGLSLVLGTSRGNHSLVEIQSAASQPLWFAIYHRATGYCAYLAVDPGLAAGCGRHASAWKKKIPSVFSHAALERIDADHLYANAEEYAEKFDSGIFGGNEFRIVTIANAVVSGAPTSAIRAFEFHDHYCPGVTSGIMMALYLKAYFPLEAGGAYFVQSVQPWCKEDALMVMLNATPGKGGYDVSYATEDDMAGWPAWARTDDGIYAATIVYRKDPESGLWDGQVLGLKWGTTDCPSYKNSVLDKLCSDLWYLNRLDAPQTFISVLGEFDLPEGTAPKDLARPGVDPIAVLDALGVGSVGQQSPEPSSR